MVKVYTKSRDATGFAVVDRDGNILIRTVAPEVRGAIVNWLFTIARVMVINSWPDDLIQKQFDLLKKEHGVRVTEVIISEKK